MHFGEHSTFAQGRAPSFDRGLLHVQVDVYSFGVIMWEVVSHEQPARGRMRELKVPQECPQEIDDLINACLSEDPASRPSAREAYDVLKAWRDKHAALLTNMRQSLTRDSSVPSDHDSAKDGDSAYNPSMAQGPSNNSDT